MEQKCIKHNYYLSILLTSSRGKRIDNTSKPTNLRVAGFYPLSFREKPAAWYSKFFQASIGKHLRKQLTNQQFTKIEVGRRQPYRF